MGNFGTLSVASTAITATLNVTIPNSERLDRNMFSFDRRNSIKILTWLSLVITLGLTACKNTDRRGPRNFTGPQIEIALAGSTEFFEGRLQADATLDSVSRRAHGPDENGNSPRLDRSGRGGRRGGDREGGRSGERGGQARNNLGSREPPVTLRIVFTNHGGTPLKFAIREVNSVLGNFVAQPDLATLEPGKSIELEPMISRMGIMSANIDLQLELRAEGQTESKTLKLQEKAPSNP